MTAVLWLTADLRLQDHPALYAALTSHSSVLPVYVLDDALSTRPGGASRWWLHHSLTALQRAIKDAGGQLILKRGRTLPTLLELVRQLKAEAVYFTRAFEPELAGLQSELTTQLQKQAIAAKSYSGRLLYEPDYIRTAQGTPFKVFGAYYRHWQKLCSIPVSQKAPQMRFTRTSIASDPLDDWQLLPSKPDWAAGFDQRWQPGFAGAEQALQRTLEDVIAGYAERRDFPAIDGTSRLSPHLAHGEISPWRVWQAVDNAFARDRARAEPFLRQLVWRDFSYYLLHYWPESIAEPFNQRFQGFQWRQNREDLARWCRGQTGYPLVDAGLRQLWQTGWMHNRVRMITASFLTKHLRLHWRNGAEFFWDTLVDADLANNTFGWQWVAGSGADAAPYFRIFNPVLQGQKFDPHGNYVREWVPELARMPPRYIHKPWDAPQAVLDEAGVRLGNDYPLPLVDHGQAREAALAAYGALR